MDPAQGSRSIPNRGVRLLLQKDPAQGSRVAQKDPAQGSKSIGRSIPNRGVSDGVAQQEP